MNAFIKGISYYLPEKVITNEDLVKDYPEWDAEQVTKKVGVKQRHVASDDETAGDMAIKAAKLLFSEYDIDASSIDFILLCTQSADYHLPSTACIIQNKLGIPTSCGALDFDLGCSGYEYGLALAKGLISGNISRNILFLTAETYTKYIHPSDHGNRSIFGDGASATLISTDGFAEIGNFEFGTDGSRADTLIVETGGARHQEKIGKIKQESGYVKSPDFLYMSGMDIFGFTLEVVPKVLRQLLTDNNMSLDDVDEFIFHQANKYMLNTVRKTCKIPKEKFFIDMENVGNTVSSTIPIALKNYISNGGSGKNIVLIGFGVGLSWGACIIHLTND